MTRLLVAGLWHETNTFADSRTGLADFHAYQYEEGPAVAARYAGTNTEIGGMVAAAEAAGIELCFALYAAAVPSGMVTDEAFTALCDRTVALARAAGPVDGALLAPHGALVVEGRTAPEAEWVLAIRDAIGHHRPVVATFDLHANLGPALVQATDALIGYDTYPHVDMAARGGDALRVMATMLVSGRRPRVAFRKLPLLTVPQTQGTADEPARGIQAALAELRGRPGIVAASVAYGFPYADVADLGVAVVAYGDDPDAAAAELAALVWSRRDAFMAPLMAPAAAVAEAIRRPGPVVLVDVADNVGGGAAGNGRTLLQALLEAGAPSAAIVLWDPVGAIARDLGGETLFSARVRYPRRSSYMTGQLVDLGKVTVRRVGGVEVMLTERRAMPFDADHLMAAGIDPAACGILVVKSAIAWKAAFGDIARSAIYVDTPGACPSDLSRLHYRHGGQGLHPLTRRD